MWGLNIIMNRKQFIDKIDAILVERGGYIWEDELCEMLSIKPYDIPWGDNVTWAKVFHSNQKFLLRKNEKVD